MDLLPSYMTILVPSLFTRAIRTVQASGRYVPAITQKRPRAIARGQSLLSYKCVCGREAARRLRPVGGLVPTIYRVAEPGRLLLVLERRDPARLLP
jgi:hypothetical protein